MRIEAYHTRGELSMGDKSRCVSVSGRLAVSQCNYWPSDLFWRARRGLFAFVLYDLVAEYPKGAGTDERVVGVKSLTVTYLRGIIPTVSN